MPDCFAKRAPAGCVCYQPPADDTCVCGDAERTLRAYSASWPMPPMTAEVRAYCLHEIDRVEGYERANYAQSTDAELARGVLEAWTAFCRDKGLL
jgi:hypothetical protein